MTGSHDDQAPILSRTNRAPLAHHPLLIRSTFQASGENESAFRMILDVSPVSMAINDDQQNILFLNKEFIATFGYTLDDIPTLSHWWPQAYPDPQYRQQISNNWQAELARSQQTQTPFIPMELVVRRKDDTEAAVMAHAVQFDMQFEDAAHRTHLVVLYDITARKRAEAEQMRLEIQLQQAMKMEAIGRLAGGIAHDFNNTLSVIFGHTALALEQTEPANPLYEDLQEIQKAAQRSAELTKQLLAFARQQAISPKVLDLNKVVLSVVKMLQRLIGSHIQIITQLGDPLWNIQMDATQMDQIVINLCVNARDAIEDTGTITVTTRNQTLDEAHRAHHIDASPGAYVVLEIRDTGRGMDQNTTAQIFEPFFSTKKVGEGTGLGLAIVHGAVTQNRGFITVESSPGAGTTFEVFLPRYEPAR